MKKCHLIKEKRNDIFAPSGLSFCTVAFENAGFGTAEKSKGTLKK